MSVDLVLKNGIVILEGKEFPRSIAIKTGKIEGIYAVDEEPKGESEIDCDGKYILPGAIDVHVHLRDLKQARKEDYISGTRAAAAGGVTTVVDMPNSVPPVLDWESLETKMLIAKRCRYVNIGFYAGIPADIPSFDVDVAKQVLGLKVYPHSPLSEGVRYDKERIRDCVKLAVGLGLPLLVHPDASDPGAEPKSIDDFFQLHSCENEKISANQFIDAIQEIGGRLHVCHVSCASTARLIIRNRAEDRLTAEVTPHHLLLSGADFSNDDGTAKMLPPLRSPYDNQALRNALCRCGIDIVASDHAPHTSEEKRKPFVDAASGIPGLETLVPLMLSEVIDGKLSWVEYLRVCSSGPARIMGLAGKGLISHGYDADLIIVAKENWKIMGTEFHSKAKVTPFEGREVRAKPVTTIVGGEVVFDHGRFLVGPGKAGIAPVRSLIQPRNT
ncbi:MAG: dihydroorotase family protein [Candidatus Thorarchaeota archaeon]